MILFFMLAGCAFRSQDAITYHSFDYPAPAKENEASVPETIMVYNFVLDSSVEIHALEISYSKGGEKTIIKHRWQDNPADMITDLVLRDLSGSGLFQKAIDQLGTARYRYALEGTIRKLQGIVQNDKASALYEIEATLIDFDAHAGKNKNLLKKTYKLEIPAKDDKPDSIVAALNQGIKEFSSQLRNDIRQILVKSGPKIKRETRLGFALL